MVHVREVSTRENPVNQPSRTSRSDFSTENSKMHENVNMAANIRNPVFNW